MSGTRSTSPNRLVALAALAVAAVLVAVLLLRAGSGTYEVDVVVQAARGVPTGAEVKAGGVHVGEVKDIDLGPGGNPRLRLRISDEYRLRRTATADVRLFSNSGKLNRYVQLEAGRGPLLADGATIDLARTDQPVEFDQAIAGLTPKTRADVRAVFANLDAGTRGRGPDIDRALRHSGEALMETADLLDDLSSDGAALRGLFRDGKRTMAALNRSPGELQRFADRLAGLLATTAGRQQQLARTARLLGPGLRGPREALARLDRSIGDLRALVKDGRPAVRELVPLARDLRPALAAARPALREARRFTREAPADLRALGPLLRSAPPILERLTRTLDLSNPMLDHLRSRAPDLFSAVGLWADMSANYDANGHAARALVLLNEAPANELKPDEFGPGYLPRPFDRIPGSLHNEPWRDYTDSFVGGGDKP